MTTVFKPKWASGISREIAPDAPDRTDDMALHTHSVSFVGRSGDDFGGKLGLEGYFTCDGSGVRLKLPTVLNVCRLYATELAPVLGVSPPPYRVPQAKVSAAAYLSYVTRLPAQALCVDLEAVTRDLVIELGLAGTDVALAQPYGMGALAGRLAIEAGLEPWDTSLPLIAAYDYMEVLLHARWAKGVAA